LNTDVINPFPLSEPFRGLRVTGQRLHSVLDGLEGVENCIVIVTSCDLGSASSRHQLVEARKAHRCWLAHGGSCGLNFVLCAGVVEQLGTKGALEDLDLKKPHRLQLAIWQGFSDLIANFNVSINAERDAVFCPRSWP